MSHTESKICASLRSILGRAEAGDTLQEFDEFSDVLIGLEYFLPEILREAHQWDESFDGFLIYSARKVGRHEAVLAGHCILISDQTTTPFHLRIQIAPSTDEVGWLEFRVGEVGPLGMIRRPYNNPPSLRKIAELCDGIDRIDWAYKVAFGVRQG